MVGFFNDVQPVLGCGNMMGLRTHGD